jgi:hypothetical protein
MFLLSGREMLLDYNIGKKEKKPITKITRRDFINGTLMLAGASMLPFGRITVASADSAANAYIHAAIDQAWRAVKELG